MKYLLSILALLVATGHAAFARNKVTTVDQVTTAVTLDQAVDYVITGKSPFAVTGSINLTHTEHAVIILKNIRPSKALEYLSFISINGEKAVNEENCQVKMYAQGTIILPYDKSIKPLTVYSEPHFQGQAVNNFGLENSGGYMNTLTAAKLNNKIRSFRLKRGYMVTFSTLKEGRGYSRCFIADNEDLEFATLPGELDRRISSYRIFKWYDAEKKGLANDTRYNSTQALNVAWCYSFSLGENRGMDCECVPHHIYEDWPSSSDCGRVTYSPHLKTNNEPGNKDDDHPQSVETILNNWENLMRTGMRLCSPSSHDGSLNHLREFMAEIDARGWRCDILDMHCYWTSGNFNNLQGWYDSYKRPIWVSEFVWGASWSNNGIFATDRTYSIANQQKNYDGMRPILENLNRWPYIERYAYWNSEADCSKIYKDGNLSILGKFYADMKSGMAYNKAYEYVPKFVYKAPADLEAVYSASKNKKQITLTWKNANGEMTDTAYVEQQDANGNWIVVETIPVTESTAHTIVYDLGVQPQNGLRNYRIHNLDSDGKNRYSNESSVSIGGVENAGVIQYGRLEILNTEDVITYFSPVDENSSIPAVFMSTPTLNNPTLGLTGAIKTVSSSQFSYNFTPWTVSYPTTLTASEKIDVFIISKGRHTFGDLTLEVADMPKNVGRDTVEVTFTQPFPEGVTPVVVAATNPLRALTFPNTIKVFDVTNKGFKAKVTRQKALDITTPGFLSQKAVYMAITPGTASLGNGKKISAGISSGRIGGTTLRSITFTLPDGNRADLKNPYIMAAPQTHYIDASSLFRYQRLFSQSVPTETGTEEVVYGMNLLRQVDKTADIKTDLAAYNGDYIGWIAVSEDDRLADRIGEIQTDQPFSVRISQRRIYVEDVNDARIYTLSGTQVRQGTPVSPGLYIVTSGKKSIKVRVK